MTRREFIGGLTGATAWPLAANAQQSAAPVIGFLRSESLAASPHQVTAFRLGLEEAGFVEGKNVAVEYHSAEGQIDRLPALVADLIRRPVAVIVGNAIAMLVAKAATTSVPIIFASGGDPVHDGLVSNLNRPGGNVTGVNFVGAPLGAKRLELLRQLVPNSTTITLLVNPNTTQTEGERGAVRAAAESLGQQLLIIDASSDRDIERGFATSVQHAAGAMLVGVGPFFDSRREQLIALAARHSVPAMYVWPEAAEIGGLMSYGTSQRSAYRQAGVYAGRILKGEKPADLPVIESSKLELVINLKTARVLGLTIPPSLLARADEVIE